MSSCCLVWHLSATDTECGGVTGVLRGGVTSALGKAVEWLQDEARVKGLQGSLNHARGTSIIVKTSQRLADCLRRVHVRRSSPGPTSTHLMTLPTCCLLRELFRVFVLL